MRISDWSSDVCSSDLDSDAFWTAQLAAVEERRLSFLDDGWSDVVVLPKGEYFRAWEFRQASKRKGGRIYIEVRDTGEIDIHEGYVTAKEAARLDKGETIDDAPTKAGPELTGSTVNHKIGKATGRERREQYG